MRAAVIAANQDYGVSVEGAELGPAILCGSAAARGLSVQTVPRPQGNKEKDPSNKRKNLVQVNTFNAQLYQRVWEAHQAGDFPLMLGGDHSAAIASALASIRGTSPMGIIWFDAHADYNTFDTTITGNLHGLPLAAIDGLCPELTAFHDGPYYAQANSVIVGGRDIDPLEAVNLEKYHVKLFSTEDIRKYGIKAVLDEAYAIAGNGTKGVHFSFDVDVMDPIAAPGVSVPAVDGISPEEALEAAHYIAAHCDVLRSLDLVEFNPLRDVERKTERVTLEILKILLDGIERV